jgi:hypothetical protein
MYNYVTSTNQDPLHLAAFVEYPLAMMPLVINSSVTLNCKLLAIIMNFYALDVTTHSVNTSNFSGCIKCGPS